MLQNCRQTCYPVTRLLALCCANVSAL
uniref:Uncharacterized protein n=1 Tax=Arundo donax TaxID=35708 RepID=A0A0A9BVW5_ARUDO